MSTFDSLKTERQPAGCRSCGDPVAGQVILAARERTSGQQRMGKSIASRSYSLCEPCAVRVYSAALDAMDAAAKERL